MIDDSKRSLPDAKVLLEDQHLKEQLINSNKENIILPNECYNSNNPLQNEDLIIPSSTNISLPSNETRSKFSTTEEKILYERAHSFYPYNWQKLCKFFDREIVNEWKKTGLIG